MPDAIVATRHLGLRFLDDGEEAAKDKRVDGDSRLPMPTFFVEVQLPASRAACLKRAWGLFMRYMRSRERQGRNPQEMPTPRCAGATAAQSPGSVCCFFASDCRASEETRNESCALLVELLPEVGVSSPRTWKY